MNWQRHLEQILVAWVLDGAPDETVDVLVPHRRPSGTRAKRREAWPVDALIYELWDDRHPLPEVAAARLNLPPLSTYAHAVRLLWSMCDGDEFPPRNCSEAAHYLATMPLEILHRHHESIDRALGRETVRRTTPRTAIIRVPA